MPISSTACSPCHIEWRPSRLGALVQAMVVVLGGVSLLLSRGFEGAPWPWRLAVILAALLVATFALVRSLRASVGHVELLPSGRARWTSEAANAAPGIEGPARFHEQWPVATLRIAGGATTLVFWPDTLSPSDRRGLRRWADAAPTASPLTQFWMG